MQLIVDNTENIFAAFTNRSLTLFTCDKHMNHLTVTSFMLLTINLMSICTYIIPLTTFLHNDLYV